MSIIHEALKKAERERLPAVATIPVYRGSRAARRGWLRGMMGGSLIGMIAVAVMSGWLWRVREAPTPPTVTAGVQTPPATGPTELGTNDLQLARHPSSAVVELLTESAPAQSSNVASPTRPASPGIEVQTAAGEVFERARAAESLGHWEQAEEHYRQALILNPTLIEARNNLGNLYIRRHLLSAAIGEFRAALAIDPNYAMARNNLGSAYFLRGNDSLAIREFLAALSIDGVYVSPYYNLATLYARRGEARQAIAFLTRALTLDPAVVTWLQADPEFDGMRSMPEFQRLGSQGLARR
jgi:tetratricopeptide (TPR) repeat protein